MLDEVSRIKAEVLVKFVEASVLAELPTYKSPKWKVPMPAEAYVAYAEGWDTAIKQWKKNIKKMCTVPGK